MRSSCLAALLLASLATAADPPAKPVKSTSRMGELLTKLDHTAQLDAEDPRRATSELGTLLTKQGYTAIPLTRTSDDMFMVRVNLDGHVFNLVLDTGAGVAFNLTKAAGKLLGIASDTHEFSDEPWSDAIPTKKYGRGFVREVSFVDADYRVGTGYSTIAIDRLKMSGVQAINPKTLKAETVQLDGLLGQGFLSEHSAVIDQDTATLYLIPLAKKEGPKLVGRWECTGGERDGKPLDKVSERWVEFRDNGLVGLQLDGNTASGYRSIRTRGFHRELFVEARGKGITPERVAYGLYRVEGDRLKLCLIDEPIEPKPNTWEGVTPPTRFEAKKDSGHIYYEFKRVKAEKK
jgi:hypothetical protein